MPTLIITFTLGIAVHIGGSRLELPRFRSAARSTFMGVLINSSQHTCRQTRNWLMARSGAFAAVFGMNMFGDSIRDLLDPR